MEFLRKHNPRNWSNDELAFVCSHLPSLSSAINVSGWKDEDREGGVYRDYFSSVSRYSVSNYNQDESRGTQNISDVEINLDEDLPDNLISKFDIAFNHTVLEHIKDPVFAYKQICLIAREVVITVVPFRQVLHYDYPYYGDYYRFTPFSLRKLNEDNGLTTLYESYTPYPASDVYIINVAVRHPELFIDFPKNTINLSEMSGKIGKTHIFGYFEIVLALILRKLFGLFK